MKFSKNGFSQWRLKVSNCFFLYPRDLCYSPLTTILTDKLKPRLFIRKILMVLCFQQQNFESLCNFIPFLFAHFIMIIPNYAWWWCCSQGKGQACYIFIPSALYFVHFLAKVIKNSSTEHKKILWSQALMCVTGVGNF